MTNRMPQIRIGLLWHTLGHYNLGVDALSRANVSMLKAAAARAGLRPIFVLLGTPGSECNGDQDIIQANRYSLKRAVIGRTNFYRNLNACDIVFDSSEGDSFSDIYGMYRMIEQSASKLAALRAGKPLILSPQTIGPFNRRLSRWLASRVMRKAKLTFTRDALSTQATKQLRCECSEAIDMAFRLPYDPPEKRTDGLLRIGVNVSGLLYSDSARFRLRIDYSSLMQKFLQTATGMTNAEVWLIPHVVAGAGGDDDIAVSERLRDQFSALQLAPKFSTSVEAKSFIAGMDIFVGARMHACIAAFSSNVPVVPIAYSRKFNGLFHTLGYRRLVDGLNDENATAEAVLMRTLAERQEAAAEIRLGLTEVEQRLRRYEDSVYEIFSVVAKGKG